MNARALLRALALPIALALLGVSALALCASLLLLGGSVAELIEPSRDLQVVLSANPREDIPRGLVLGLLAAASGVIGISLIRRATAS